MNTERTRNILALLAEVERMRPVVEAAEAWRDHTLELPFSPGSKQTAIRTAVDAYRAQKAPLAPPQATRADLPAQPVADTTLEPPNLLQRVRRTLQEHYLLQIVCDHDRQQDNPICACARVFLGWHPTIPVAVDAWIDHALSALTPAGDDTTLEAYRTTQAFLAGELGRAHRERDALRREVADLRAQLDAALVAAGPCGDKPLPVIVGELRTAVADASDQIDALYDLVNRTRADREALLSTIKTLGLVVAEEPGELSDPVNAPAAAVRLIRNGRQASKELDAEIAYRKATEVDLRKTVERDQALRAEVERLAELCEQTAKLHGGLVAALFLDCRDRLRAALAGHGDPAKRTSPGALLDVALTAAGRNAEFSVPLLDEDDPAPAHDDVCPTCGHPYLSAPHILSDACHPKAAHDGASESGDR